MNVTVSETHLFGLWLYRVRVDSQVYDQFTTYEQLTRAERDDVATMYAEALDNYDAPMLGLSNHEKLRRP